jgi:hypothetical protein
MGTAGMIASTTTQQITAKSIFGAFVVIILIIAFYNLFKTSKQVKLFAFITIVGVVTISSLILYSSVVVEIIKLYGALL